jgi:hypothetical protein
VGQLSGPQRTSEHINPSRIDSIPNRDAFLGMDILDVGANYKDNHRAIFRRSLTNALEGCFIDPGHMFGGPENPIFALNLEMAVYADLWQDEQVVSWISRLQTIIPKVLTSIVSPSASEWYSGDLNELHSRQAARLLSLPELVQADTEKAWHPRQQKSVNESLRLSDFGIHDLRTPDTRSSFYRARATA